MGSEANFVGEYMDDIAFVLKKIVSSFVYPLGASVLLLFVGLAVWRIKRSCRAAMLFVCLGTALLMVMSFPITSALLVKDIEKKAGSYADVGFLRSKHVRYIVVLGGAGRTAELTPADRTGPSIFRVMEGVRLWKSIPGSKLVLSGSGFGREANSPELMKQLPLQLGVPEKSLIVKAQAWDTPQEAKLFSDLVGKEPFALVTSAYHMPRAMMLFQARGLHPIASPCEFKGRVPPPWYRLLVPSAEALVDSTLVLHEYIGMVWAEIQTAPGKGAAARLAVEMAAPPILSHNAVKAESR